MWCISGRKFQTGSCGDNRMILWLFSLAVLKHALREITTRHDKEKTAIIKSGIVFNNDVSEIIAFRHMVVSLAVSNHILRKNDDKETLSQSTRELMRRRSMANGLRTLRRWVDNDDFFYLECLVVDHRSEWKQGTSVSPWTPMGELNAFFSTYLFLSVLYVLFYRMSICDQS